MSKPITPDLVYELTAVAEPALSPDGQRLAFVRSKVDAEKQEAESRLMMTSLPDGEPSEFTSGTKDGGPRFSPDCQTLAFLRADDKDRRQVWLISVGGGEARQLTSEKGGVNEVAWSPDSGRLVYVSDIDPDRPPEDHDPKKDPRVRVVQRVRFRFDTVGWRGDAHRHLFVADVGSGESRQLTDGDWDDGFPTWSPDGSQVAFVSDRADDRDIRAGREAYVISADGGEAELWSGDLLNVVSLAWAPDGRRLLALGSRDPENMGHWQGRLYVLERGRDPVEMTDDSVSPVGGFPGLGTSPDMRWTEDGRIIFLGDRKGETYLFELDAASGEYRRELGGGGQLTGLALDTDVSTAAVVATTPNSAGDLHLIELTGNRQSRVTSYNDEYFEERPTGGFEKFTLDRGDLEIESRVIFPPDFDESRSYPLVLDIHGGPHGVFYDSFNPMQQVMATAGYVVLAVNPRGSSTYGEDFMKAVIRDWGGEDYLDIMAVVEDLAGRSYVDESRMGVMGYSYGGFMTSWIVGHETRFKAAVVGAPCINLSSMYGTSDIGISFGEVQWGGMRKDALELFLDRSPLTYAPHVETPVLLLHGEDDYRCPIGQSEEYFVTLKRLGKEVEFVRFPGSAHSFLRGGHPKLRKEYLTRMLDWFNGHMVTEPIPEA